MKVREVEKYRTEGGEEARKEGRKVKKMRRENEGRRKGNRMRERTEGRKGEIKKIRIESPKKREMKEMKR